MSDGEHCYIQSLELRFEDADFGSEADQLLIREVLALVNEGIETAAAALVRHPELANQTFRIPILSKLFSPIRQRSLGVAIPRSIPLSVAAALTAVAMPLVGVIEAVDQFGGLLVSVVALVIAVDVIAVALFARTQLASVELVFRRIPIAGPGVSYGAGTVGPWSGAGQSNKAEETRAPLIPPFVIFEVVDGSIILLCQRAMMGAAALAALAVADQIVQGSKVGKFTIAKGIQIVDTATDIVAERFGELAALKDLDGKGQVKKDRLILYVRRSKPEDDAPMPDKLPKRKRGQSWA